MSTAYIPSALRRLVYERAGGRCEYCRVPETAVFAAHEIDHIISEKHEGPTEAENLALCCALCNQHKGSDIASIDPATNQIAPLFHPRHERWQDHFMLREAQIIPLTSSGRVTVRLLQFNHPDRLEERELLIAAGALSPPV